MEQFPFFVIFLEFFLLFFYVKNSENEHIFLPKKPEMNPKWNVLLIKSYIAVIYSISNQSESYTGLQ